MPRQRKWFFVRLFAISLTCVLQWSLAKRCWVTFQITWLTFSIYIAPSIWAPGIPDLSEKLGISYVAGDLGITMFVLGYACGPVSPTGSRYLSAPLTLSYR